MLNRLHSSDPHFDTQLKRFLENRQEEEASVVPTVSSIIQAVKARGDEAVLDYTNEFDRVKYRADEMRVTDAERSEAMAACSDAVIDALHLAAKRIHDFHQKQLPQDIDYTDEAGVRLGMVWSAISDVGLYVPGGLASYPSSVLMNAIPAKVAGVERLVMVVPTPDGVLNPSVLAAAHIAGIDEIYKIGGAQAVAAMAYGTETIRPVHKIVGPGNAYVAEAKRQVFGKVGIDMIAGPSEILVVADAKNNPNWIAADLLSQAEHDAHAQSILLTDDAAFADAVDSALCDLLSKLDRREIAETSIRQHGLSLVVDKLENAVPIINEIAAEHIELAVEDPDALADQIHHGGAIFLGRYTPEAIGDYMAGPSHVLPTTQTAKFSSGLSVYDFIKKTSLVGCSPEAFQMLADSTAILADNEGLGAHALSIHVRRN